MTDLSRKQLIFVPIMVNSVIFATVAMGQYKTPYEEVNGYHHHYTIRCNMYHGEIGHYLTMALVF